MLQELKKKVEKSMAYIRSYLLTN